MQMKNTKLIEILRTFSKEEFRLFGKFVESPYFNGRSEMIRFYESIKKGYPEFNGKQFQKNEIFKKVYPRFVYKDSLMRKLISGLTKLSEEFLIQRAFRKEDFDKQKYLLLELRHRRLDDLFEHFAVLTEKGFENKKKNFLYFYKKSIFYNILNGYNGYRNLSLVDRNFQEEADNFFYFFLCKSLEIYTRLINQKSVFNKDFNLILFDEIIGHLNKNTYEDIPLIPIHYNYIKLLRDGDEMSYSNIKKLYRNHQNDLDKNDEINLFIILRNYCIAQFKKGNLKYRNERFELDKEFLAKGLPGESEFIQVYFFLNVVTNAALIKEFKWADAFIEDYAQLLYPKYKPDAPNLALAIIDFEKGKFEDSLAHLGKINIELCHLKIDVKNLMLKIYYELGLSEQAIFLIDTYRHYLKRDETITDYNRVITSDFLKFYSELIRLDDKNKDLISEFRDSISKSGYFTNKEWVLEKVNALG